MTEERDEPMAAEGPAADADAPAGADAPAADAATDVPADTGDASLLALIDRLGLILERSDLTELEVEAGGTALVLRKAVAVAATVPAGAGGGDGAGTASPTAAAPAAAPGGAAEAAPPSRPSVKAPLTGIWYGSPAPGSAPFVEAGREVAVGQVVGLIEAMKLFNEIKSDLAGRVVRVVPESGALVKAKQPLIEVDPL